MDQTDPEEVPEEEEGGAEKSEIKENEEEAEMKVVSKRERSCQNPKLYSISFRCLKMWNWNQILFKPLLI